MNTKKGRDFQKEVALILKDYYKVGFRMEYSIRIGNPSKEHRFDLVSDDMHYIGECKNYSWTESGNVPSAKIAFINEAVFYLQHLNKEIYRFVVMRKDFDSRCSESLAEYYYRINMHLLNGIYLIEVDLTAGALKELGQ